MCKEMATNAGLPQFYANTRQGEEPRHLNADSKSWFPFFPDTAAPPTSDYRGMVPRGNFGNTKEGGSGIDMHSDLLWGAPGTARSKGGKQTFARPFATTPFLGLGTIEGIDDQSRVMFGHATANRKSIQTVTDKQFPVFEPLIAERAADIPENNYFVEPFLRGGLVSRLIPRVRVDLTK